MIIMKCKNERELTKKKTTQINVFYKGEYLYKISIVENENIIKVEKEHTKSEYFETEYLEII